jgi:hypothetical protein
VSLTVTKVVPEGGFGPISTKNVVFLRKKLKKNTFWPLKAHKKAKNVEIRYTNVYLR